MDSLSKRLLMAIRQSLLVDTGSAATFMSDTFAKRAGVVLFPWIGKCYHLANGQKVKPGRKRQSRVRINN